MLKSIGSNWARMVVMILATYVLLPFNLKALGQDQYGVWLLITSMVGYLTLLMLGVPTASVRYIAKYSTAKDYDAMNKVIGSCAGLYITLGVVAAAIGLALLFVFERAYTIPAELSYTARAAFLLILVNIAAGFFAQLPLGIMAAHHDFLVSNAVQVAIVLTRMAANIILISARPTLAFLAASQLVSLVIEAALMWTVIWKRYPHVKLRLANFELATVRQIFSFSIYILILGLGTQLSFQTDSLVIGKFLHIDMIPYYTVANSLAFYMVEFMIGIGAVVMPLATKLQTENRLDDLKDVFLKWSKISFSLAVLGGVYLIVMGPEFIGTWVGRSFEGPAGAVLQILIFSNIVFLPMRGVALPILMGLGAPVRATIAFAAAGVLNLVMSIALVKPYGLVGVAWGTAIPNILFALALLVFACRDLGVSLLAYSRYVVPKAVIGALPVAAVLWLFRRAGVEGYFWLAVAGVAAAAVFVPVWAFFVYRKDPFVDIAGRLAQVLRWRFA